MSYIGNQPTSVAFLTDQFSGNGTDTAFIMSVAPATTGSILVAITGVVQDPSTYSVSGTTLTFSQAPPSGTGNISVRYLGIPASGVTTTAYRTVTEFTATAGQTTFSVPSYTVGYIDVYRNGVMLGSADYTASNGTTVVLASGATAGDLIETISFYVSSVLNAIPATAGSVGSSYIANDAVGSAQIAAGAVGTSEIANGVTINFADGSASTPSITNDGDTNTGMFFPAADTIAFAEGGVEAMRLDASGNVGIGTASPSARLAVQGAAGSFTNLAVQCSDSNMSRLSLNNSNRSWTISNYGSQFAPNGSFNIADETGAAVVFRLDTAGNIQFNSGYGSLATAYGCRAWVNFNGTGTVAINASGNVSSITDNGTGAYTINFTTAMPDANYQVNTAMGVLGSSNSSNSVTMINDLGAVPTTSALRIGTYFASNGSAYDVQRIYVSIFR